MTAATIHKIERSNHNLAFLLGHTRFAIDISSTLSATGDFNIIESPKCGKFNELFNETKSPLQTTVHLVITKDGVTPCYALMLDNIDNMTSYEGSQFTQMRDPNYTFILSNRALIG